MWTFFPPLVGINFRHLDARTVASNLAEGDILTLEREPSNQFDINAIKVIHPESGEFIGYIARMVAAEIAVLIDQGKFYVCTVAENAGLKNITLCVVFTE